MGQRLEIVLFLCSSAHVNLCLFLQLRKLSVSKVKTCQFIVSTKINKVANCLSLGTDKITISKTAYGRQE